MGQQAFQDDPAITDETRLFRRVHPTQLAKDEDTGLTKVSSAVFKDIQLSVNIETILLGLSLTPDACLKDYPNYKLISIDAGVARSNGLAVFHDPLPEDPSRGLPEDPSHGLVYGKKTSRIFHALRDAAQWVIPDRVPLWEEKTV